MDGDERMKILLLEDDNQASRYVARGLTEEGHVMDVSGNAAVASDMIHVSAYDILIVDRMLPGLDGLSFVSLGNPAFLRFYGVRFRYLIDQKQNT